MSHATSDGLSCAVPMPAIKNADHAIDFYRRAFGAVEMFRLTEPSGGIAWVPVGSSNGSPNVLSVRSSGFFPGK